MGRSTLTLEGLMAAYDLPHAHTAQTRCPEDLKQARHYYNHIAWQLAVGICRLLIHKAWIVPGEREWHSRLAAAPLFDRLDERRQAPLQPARLCLDWSERQYHLACALGDKILKRCSTGAGSPATVHTLCHEHRTAFGIPNTKPVL
jgi:hypothetical protein